MKKLELKGKPVNVRDFWHHSSKPGHVTCPVCGALVPAAKSYPKTCRVHELGCWKGKEVRSGM